MPNANDDPPPSTCRCPVCGARDRREEGAWVRCGHCGLRVDAAPGGVARAERALDGLLRPGAVDVGAVSADARATSAAPAALAMDAYTLRTAASARGLGFEPGDAAQREALARPHSELPGRGRLTPFAPTAARVTLGMIVRGSEAEAAFAFAARWRGRFAGAVLALDEGGDGTVSRTPGGPRVLRHPLGGDFGAQRNRVQAAAPTPWVLQLDLDETPEAALLDTMDALAVQADAHGLVSIGLPRRNLVDGALSDLYPDVQYRLNRREVRYAGTVHERPGLGGAWWTSMIAPGAVLTHRLDGARVRERSVRYEAMRAGAGRAGDEAALLRPFRGRARAGRP